MPYDDIYYFNNVSIDGVNDPNDNITDNVEAGSEDSFGEDQTEYDGISDYKSNEFDSVDSNEFDYTIYLEDIIANQETIIANQEILIGYEHNISDNSFRLYYFIGGIYVAFAIVIMIKFFKTFLF